MTQTGVDKMTDLDVRKVLDPAQLTRIRATHSGFVYQNIYAVACLLSLASLKSGSVSVERDEDVEFDTKDTTYFLQVKLRGRSLGVADVSEALTRFATIRQDFKDRKDPKRPIFAIVATSSPSPILDAVLSTWPDDVYFLCPDRPVAKHPLLPNPFSTIEALLSHTENRVKDLAFPGLDPRTLVLKIAAYIHYLSTGRMPGGDAHRVDRSELEGLFETYAVQMQRFPIVADNYRPQTSEPPFTTEAHLRLIVGFSGAGKTAWAAMQGAMSASPSLYFDLRGYPSAGAPSALAREITAVLLGKAGMAGRLPVGHGLEMLSHVNEQLGLRSPRPLIVIDNVHEVSVETLQAIVERGSNLSFLCLSQPTQDTAHLAGVLRIETESLNGWSAETVAEVFAEAGCAVSPQSAAHWHKLTGGLPLYVLNAANIARRNYAGDIVRFAEDIATGHQSEAPIQEIILERTFNELSVIEAQVLSILVRAGLALTCDELEQISTATSRTDTTPLKPVVRPALRTLSRLGLVNPSGRDMWSSHDAATVIGLRHIGEMASPDRDALLHALASILLASLQDQQSLDRLSVWVRLLPEIGQTSVLAEVASLELFHEVGNPDDLKIALQSAESDPSASPQTRFTASDALAFWAMQGDLRKFDPRPHLENMKRLLHERGDHLDADAALSLAMKEMVLAGRRGDETGVAASFNGTRSYLKNDPVRLRILRYTHAASLFHLGGVTNVRTAEQTSHDVALEIYEALGVAPSVVVGANPKELRRRLEPITEERQDEIKRLADCLDLFAACQRRLGRVPVLTRIYAAKLYQQVGAWKSMAKTAQENAQDYLDLGDAEGAVSIFETFVLPTAAQYGLHELRLEFQSFYAVTLAYAGRFSDARQTIAQLSAYKDVMHPDEAASIAEQTNLIEAVASGDMQLVSLGNLPAAPPLI